MNNGQLLERGHELAVLRDALAYAASGTGQAIILEGPAGIGKTSLLSEAGTLAEERGFRVLTAAGGAWVAGAAFGVVRELFMPVFSPGSAWDTDDVTAGPAALALPVLGLADVTSEGSSREARASAVHGLSRLALNLAAETPLLLALDDVHAADHDSLHWLVQLSRHVGGSSLLVLIAMRPNGDVRTTGDIAGLTGVTALRPQPLSLDAVQEFMTARTGISNTETAAQVFHATGGVPFLVSMSLEAIALGGPPRGPATDGQDIRSITAATLGSRIVGALNATTPGGYEVALAAALLGPEGERYRVAALTGLSFEDVGSIASALAAEGYTREGWPLRFLHPLIEESITGACPSGRLADLHAAAAGMLLDEGVEPERCAVHLLVADPTGDPSRAELLRDVAARELVRGAPFAAVEYLERALREPPPATERWHYLLELGRAQAHALDPAAVETLANSARMASAPLDRVEALVEQGWASLTSGDVRSAMTVHQAALDVLPQEEAGRELELRAELLAMAQFEMCTELEITGYEELVPPIREGDRSIPARRALAALAHVEFARNGCRERALALARRAIGDGLVPPIDLISSPAFLLARETMINSDEIDVPVQLAQDAVDWALRHGAPTLLTGSRSTLVHAAWRAGRLLEVDEVASAVLDAVMDGTVGIQHLIVLPVLARAQVELGRLDDARDLMTTFGMLDAAPADLPFSTALVARASYWLSVQEPGRALADLEFCGERLTAHGLRNPCIFEWRSLAALALLQLGRADEALTLVDEELDLATRYGAPRAIGIAQHTRGLVVGRQDGLADLESAAVVFASSADRLAHARALVDLGAAQRRKGLRRKARMTLQSAREMASGCGASPLVTAAQDELELLGARALDKPTHGLGALTASEHRVVALAGSGASNQEIAQQLFISLKTVETHLSRAYRKLGVTGRSELPRIVPSDED